MTDQIPSIPVPIDDDDSSRLYPILHRALNNPNNMYSDLAKAEIRALLSARSYYEKLATARGPSRRYGSVIIVGQAPRSFEHPATGADIWVINGPNFPERWDVLFQLHGPDHIAKRHGENYLYLISTQYPHAKIYTTDAVIKRYPDKGMVRFPYDEIEASFGSYFNNSVPLLIAYAVLLGYDKITLDGVMYGNGATEAWAVPCIEYHLGLAIGKGVTVKVPPNSGLLVGDALYGYEGPGCV